ncbi:hypothetical protein BC939DRAFT_532922 [Gamsiella multidivaricata]|uniref:uncharacterized protein n=1 Tax=Gamsiella multidivaricata TaxID=101098 RepID=UPI0022202361|nr:uncharacterized protein BC939DRAFT_532922 [Gamsiella multidivaricata]KAI7817253.1 hypothetical protein BC939DRAFT_532922 [Gamsiella multidivaricata]
MVPEIQDQHNSALPYPVEETDYQDHHAVLSSRAPSQTGSKPSSFYSFVSTSSSTRTSPSIRSKKSSQSRGGTKEKIYTSTPHSLNCGKQHTVLQNYSGNNDDDGGMKSFVEYENEASIKPYQKPFYRRRRFWWTCTISTALFLVIILPLFLIVILPKIAQAMINTSTMKISQMNMTDPQERSVQVSVEAAILGIPSMFAAKVEFQTPVQVYWVREQGDQTKVGQMNLDTIEKRAFSKAQFTQATVFEIVDSHLFGEFAKVMMASDTFLWRITAQIDVSVIGRTIKNLRLNSPLISLILSFDIPSDAPNGAGALVSIKVSIPNPSPIGMSLGTLVIDMSLKSTYLGRITARNVTLIGNQPATLQLDGMINKQTDPLALQELSSMISNYLANTPTTAYGQGVSVLPDGVHNISWITAAIVATRMAIPLLAPTPMNMIKEVNIKDLNLIMSAQQPWAPTAASTGIAAMFQLPFNLSLNITDIWDPKLTLGYQSVSIADITTAVWNRNNSDMIHNNISFTLPPSQMPIRPDAHDQFGKFLIAVTNQDTALFDILGSAQSVASTSLGQVNITVPFNTSLTLKGVNFGEMTPQLNGIAVASATVDYVVLNATVVIDNPSIFTVEAGPVTLQINATVHGMTDYVGEVMITNLKLSPGPNPLQAFVHFQPTNTTFRNAFFTEYIVGTNFEASIYGNTKSSPIVSLAPIMESLKMSTTVPGMNPAPKLIVGGNGNTTVGQFLNNHKVMLQVQILNPLATTLWIHNLTADVSWKGFPFGAIQIAQSFSIKPSGVDTSPLFGIQIPSSYNFWVFMVTTFLPQNIGILTGATVVVDLTADIMATVDGTKGVGYEAEIRYSQDQVGVFLKIEFSLAGIGIGRRRKKRGVMEELDGDGDFEERYGITDELGPEPDKQNTDAYLAWLKRAVQLSFPEEAAADGWM